MTCLWETQHLIIACSPSLAIFQCDCVELIIGNYSKGKESDPTNSLADVFGQLSFLHLLREITKF